MRNRLHFRKVYSTHQTKFQKFIEIPYFKLKLSVIRLIYSATNVRYLHEFLETISFRKRFLSLFCYILRKRLHILSRHTL